MTATGAGLFAERIIAAAREAGVPVREDPALVEALAALNLGAHVPEALWKAVAETLAWAYRLDAGARASERSPMSLDLSPGTRPPMMRVLPR